MKELKRYYRQICSWLPCGGNLKRHMMSNIKYNIEDYLLDNPDADFSAVQAHFGTPQQIATAFVDEMNTEELLKTLKIRRRIVKIFFGCAIASVVLWGIALLIITWYDQGGFSTIELILQ